MCPSEITVDARMIHSSGIGTYIANLLPALTSCLPAVKFNVLGDASELKTHRVAAGANVDIIDCRSPIYSIAEQIELIRRIPRGTDLFWSPHYNIPLLYRGKQLVTVHDVCHLAMPQYVVGAHKRLYARLLFNAIRRKACRVLCDSEFTAGELARLVGMDRNMLQVLHIGVEDSWHEVKKGKRPYIKPYILYVGNVKPHKNLTGLVKAFESLVGEVPHDLVIVGKKEGFITGDRIAGELAEKHSDRIHFTGFVTDEALREHYAHADVLVLPSFYEGFGLPPLEAMACGCPCVISNAASLPEVCGDAAIYCDPYDVSDIARIIREVVTDRDLHDRLMRRGKDRARQFTWEKTARVLKDVVMDTLHS